jgi:hypothetical protein
MEENMNTNKKEQLEVLKSNLWLQRLAVKGLKTQKEGAWLIYKDKLDIAKTQKETYYVIKEEYEQEKQELQEIKNKINKLKNN